MPGPAAVEDIACERMADVTFEGCNPDAAGSPVLPKSLRRTVSPTPGRSKFDGLRGRGGTGGHSTLRVGWAISRNCGPS